MAAEGGGGGAAAAAATTSKKVLNAPEAAVHEMLEGVAYEAPNVTRLDGFDRGVQVLLRTDWSAAASGKVALVSGGGSGHEPAHGGYIGAGMLTAVAAGNVYASPSVLAVLSAIRAVARPGGPGCLLIVKNYTGDRLNFGLAAEKAALAGIDVETVYVADDAALETGKVTGRRGIAGTVFVHKVAGAAAEAGLPLAEVAREARAAAAAVSSMGVALSACTVPGSARSTRLDGDVIEIGLGIHGEPGAARSAPLPADELVDRILGRILEVAPWAPGGAAATASAAAADVDAPRLTDAGVALLVNNLGGTTAMEISVVVRRAVRRLGELGIKVARLQSGHFMTALDMAGFSLSVLPLTPLSAARLDAPTSAPAWRAPVVPVPAPVVPMPEAADGEDGDGAARFARPAALTPAAKALESALLGAANGLAAAEPELTRLDTLAGDGDCGHTMARGAAAVIAGVRGHYPLDSPADTLAALGASIRASMDGSSGALYDIMCLAAERHMRERGGDHSPAAWAGCLRAAVAAVVRYGNARAGDRTMVDALLPACAAAEASIAANPDDAAAALDAAARGARDGAQATAGMAAGAGRASYVEASVVDGVVDPGALAVAEWLKGAAAGYSVALK